MERELLLLGLLNQEGRHGYELHDFIEKYMQTCVDIKKPTAYYLLDKLAKGGFITETVEQSGNRPARRVYQLTEAGNSYFDHLLRDYLSRYSPTQFADLVGLASPFLKRAVESTQAVVEEMELLWAELRIAMFCSGVATIDQLRQPGVLMGDR